MAPAARGRLLGAKDPPPVEIINPQGRSPFLLVADHAGHCIPKRLGTLGLAAADRERHIGWDIGTAALGALLAERLDAVLLRQAYSRLVIDCNRDPESAEAMPLVSDGTAIPGNRDLSAADRCARIEAIHAPYQRAIAEQLARKLDKGQRPILVSLHSFTPIMQGIARPWQIGILHDGANDGLALSLRDWLRRQDAWVIGDNQPYAMDATDHTVPRHAFAAGLPYLEIEISQGELAPPGGPERWSGIIADGLSHIVKGSPD
jgi:predicted N-formylglutamate amidohydrolase